jgi:hypothetical protein
VQAPGVKKGIVFDDQPTNFLLGEHGETVLYLRVVAGFQNYRFPAHCRHRKFKVVLAQAALNTLLVGEKSNGSAGRQKLDQQPEPLSRELRRSSGRRR